MSTVLSILVLAILALPLGAWVLWRKGARLQAVLMVILALVAAVNVAIWTMPDGNGNSPVAGQLK